MVKKEEDFRQENKIKKQKVKAKLCQRNLRANKTSQDSEEEK